MSRRGVRRAGLAAFGLLAAVAYVRVRRERAAVRGGAPPAAPDDPPAWEPAALTALASWVPAAPRTPLARAVAYAWAAPLTAAGLVVGALGGCRPQRREGALLFAETRGPMGAYLERRGFSACTLGHVVIATGEPSPALLAHELVHVRQAERLGPLMAPLYAAFLGLYGYARNPLERAARTVQSREG